MVVNFNALKEAHLRKFIDKNKSEIEESIKKIEHEYKSLTFEKRELNRNKELAKMMFMETKHNAIVKIVTLYLETKDIEVLEVLNELDVKFDRTKPIKKQLERARRETIGLRNKMNIAQANFKRKYKIDDDVVEEYNENDVEKNLDSQALSMEGNLETGYKIDIRTTSVLRWLNLMESNRRRIEQFNKN